MRIFLVYWVPFLLYVGLIFLASSISKLPFDLPSVRHLDKLLHFGEYALLAVLVARAMHSLRRPEGTWLRWLSILAIVVAFGALDELYQSTIPNRQPDWVDLMADGMGGLLGCLVYLASVRLRDRRRVETV